MPSIPTTMRAAAIDRFGGPEVLRLHSSPVPVPDASEILIAMHTAGVGIWDAQIRAGKWASRRTRFPLILGTDGSGTVAAVGARIRRFGVGDRVYAYSYENPKGGFCAEYVAVRADAVAHIPKLLPMQQAGVLPTIGLTALQGIDDALRLRRRETCIVHGASGSVGSIAVQFAKMRGARVFATASGDDGVAMVRELGADVAID